eukprot:scaffold151438_cov26-Tisochrysis_lutea.AAC.7
MTPPSFSARMARPRKRLRAFRAQTLTSSSNLLHSRSAELMRNAVAPRSMRTWPLWIASLTLPAFSAAG